MRADAGGALDPMDDEGSFDDGDPYTTNLYIGKPRSTHMCLLTFSFCSRLLCCIKVGSLFVPIVHDVLLAC